jgi:hypothetical protein
MPQLLQAPSVLHSQGIGEQNLEEEGHVTTVYSEIRNQDKAIMTI